MSDLEHIAKWIANHRTPVSVRRVKRRFQAHGSCTQRSLVRVVCIIHVDVEERREPLAFGICRHHHQRVPDQDLRRSSRRDLSLGVEDVTKEVDLGLDVTHDDARSHRMETVARPGHAPVRTVRSRIPSVARNADSGTIGKRSLASSPTFDQS
jgi:hypothetical protein